MRRAHLAIHLSVLLCLPLAGCKRKELEAALAKTQAKLTETERALADEQGKNQKLTEENQSLQQRIADLEENIRQLESQIEDLAKKQGVSAAELAELRAEKAKREKELRVYKDFYERLKSLIAAGTITVTFRKGRLVVHLSSAILFDSGKTDLKPEGQQAISQLIPALQSVGDRAFLVAGHTDNVPIKTARFRNNWELSTARAVTVVNFMIEQGYPAERLGAAGYGEYDPVADNNNEGGRSNNRRIEVILMPNLGDVPGIQEMLSGK